MAKQIGGFVFTLQRGNAGEPSHAAVTYTVSAQDDPTLKREARFTLPPDHPRIYALMRALEALIAQREGM